MAQILSLQKWLSKDVWLSPCQGRADHNSVTGAAKSSWRPSHHYSLKKKKEDVKLPRVICGRDDGHQSSPRFFGLFFSITPTFSCVAFKKKNVSTGVCCCRFSLVIIITRFCDLFFLLCIVIFRHKRNRVFLKIFLVKNDDGSMSFICRLKLIFLINSKNRKLNIFLWCERSFHLIIENRSGIWFFFFVKNE
jgi:hypothetical protein